MLAARGSAHPSKRYLSKVGTSYILDRRRRDQRLISHYRDRSSGRVADRKIGIFMLILKLALRTDQPAVTKMEMISA